MRKIAAFLFFLSVPFLAMGSVENLKKAVTPPVIDGQEDELWENTGWISIRRQMYPEIQTGPAYARFKLVYDDKALYIIARVYDDVLNNAGGPDFYFENDCIELFFDMGNEKTVYPDENDFQFCFIYNMKNIYSRENPGVQPIEHAWITEEDGYMLEVKIPLQCVNTNGIAAGDIIGFDILVNDRDNGFSRDSLYAWSGNESDRSSSGELGELIVTDHGVCEVIEAEDASPATMGVRNLRGIAFAETMVENHGELVFDFFSLPSGVYSIWAKVSGKDRESNEFGLVVDNGLKTRTVFIPDEEFYWTRLTESPAVFRETRNHTVRLYGEEKYAKIDKIILTNDNREDLFRPIDRPEITNVELNGGEVKLEWDMADTGRITGYRIERQSGGGVFEYIGETEGNVYCFHDASMHLHPDPCYRVIALAGPDNSPYSKRVYLDYQVPRKPFHLTVTQHKFRFFNACRLSWENDDDEVVSFEIERRMNDHEYTVIKRIPAGKNEYYDVAFGVLRMRENKTPCYRIRSYNGRKYSPYAYPETDEDLIKDIRYSNGNSDIHISSCSKRGIYMYQDLRERKAEFRYLPDYLEGIQYIRGFYFDANIDDDDYLAFRTNKNIRLYLAVAHDSDINDNEWTLIGSKVNINPVYYPRGVDIYSKVIRKGEDVITEGNRNYSPHGNTFFLFCKEEENAFIGINFGPKETGEVAGYYLDCGKTYALHENGYTYGWEKAGNGKINSKTNMPGIDMCGKGHTPLKDRNDCLESTWLYMTGETGWKILLENGYYRIRAGFADPVRPYGLYKKADDTFEIYINNKHYALEAGDRFFFGNNDRDLMMLDDVIVSEFCGNQLVIRGGVQKIAIQYLEIEKIDDVIVNRCYASDDTYIESGKRGRLNVNGDKPYVIVQDFEKFSGSKKIGCLEFAPDNVAGIHSAYLSLYYHGSDGGPPHTVSLQLYAIDGHDFDETSLNWNNAAFITGEDKYKTDIIKEALLVDEILLDKTDNSYCSFDITSYMKDRFDSVVTFLLVCGKGTDLGSVFFSKEAGVNPPFIEINRVKNRISQTGFLTGNRESGFELATYNGTVFDGETYNLESDYLNLEEYTDCNVRITGYFVPEQDVPVDRTIHVEDLNAVAPDKPELIVDRINKDGRPVWAWNKPIGALLFAYSLDDGEWTDAVETSFSPAIPLPEGTHRLRLKCRNRLLWSETAEAAVLIDMTAPEITSMAFDTPTKNRKPVFIWTARDGLTNDRELVYRYRIDEGEWHLSIENRYTPGENLSEGNHMFGIGARDLAGNWSDVREYPFCIDITPPRVTDVSYETPTMDRRPRFQWSADDNYTETGDIEYLICFYSPSQDESVPDDSGKAAEGFIVTKETSFTSSSDAGDGSHMFMISARDRAGNCSILENHEVIVDTTPPLIHNLDYHDSESGPAYIWDVTDNYSPEEDIDYECLLTTDNDSDGNWKPVSGNSIAIDPLYRTTAHTFTLRAKDRAGNMSEKSADTKSGVTIACGEVTLAIPENALQEIVPIRISKADPLQLAPDDTDKVIIAQCAFELKPDGLTFSRSYTLSIDYSGYELLCDEDYLGIYYYDENEKHWEQVMPSETDKIGKIITAQCNHFSVFALGYPIVNEIAMFAPEKPAGQTVGEWFVDAPDSVINAVRNRITENPDIDIVTVYVRGGDYYCGTEDEVLILEDIDFGFGRKVVFKALPGENVRIIGGVRIRADLFHPVTDPLILQKIPDEAGEIVRVVDLVNDVGIDEFPDLKHRGRNTEGRNAVYKTDDLNQEFYFNRRPMQIARWPNKELVGPDDNSVCSQEDYARMTRRGELSFDVALPEEDRSRPGRWTESAGKDLWIFYFNNNNEEELMKVRDISGNTVNLAYMDDPEDSGLLDNHLFYAFNVLEELDSPGEYFLDRDPEHPANHGRLYFYPPEDLVDDMYLSNTKTLMTVRNCSNMTFDGFVFEGSKENCVEVWNSNNIVFEQCVIRNAGKAGILISTEIDGETGRHAYNGDRGLSDNHPVNTLNSRNCGLKDSEVYDTGENAVVIDGGNRAYLKPCRHFLQNCSIHHFGRVEKSRTAVIISGIGINVIHNEISRGPSMGIYYFGNDHLIQYNNIYRVCQEVEDMGAVYSGMDIGYRGNVIKNNLIYHIKTKFKDEEGVHCIYFDQGYSSAEVLGNIIYDSNGMAVFVGGGRDNKIKYNVIAEHGGAAIINRCAFLDRYWGDNDFELDKKLSEFRYWTSPWSYRYHDLMRHYYDENKYDRTMPFWNKLDDNIIYRSNLYPLMPTATLEDLESYGLEIVSVSEHRTEMLYHIDIPITEDLHLKWDVTIIFPFNVYLFNTGYVKIGSFAGEPGGINMAVPIFDPYFFTSFIIDALMSDKYLSNKNNAIVDPGFVDPDNENFTFSASSIIHELRDSWQSGLWDPILDGETYFGRIPNKPVVILEPDAENNRIRVTGNCDPWAEIKEAVLYGLDESGGVVNSLAVTDNLTRQDNGSISGILYPPGAFYTSQFCVLDITLKHSKEASYALEAVTGRSGRINFTYTDTTAPEITVFDVNDPVITDGGIEISFDCEAEDDVGISQWMITLAAEKPFFFDERWEDEKPDMVVLPLASGTYHLYVWAKDASNNISDSMSDTVVIDPIPVSGVMQYTSPGLYEWRITDKYLTVTNVIVNVTLIAGGGGGGGGASNSDIGLNFWGDCVAGCTDKASGGGGGGAGEAIELTLSEADMTFDKYRLIEIVVGGPGTGGDGGGKQHSGKSGTSGGYSRFDTHTARPGGGGGGGNNDSSSWGKGGSGYPGGGNHSGREGGEGGNNGSGYGRGGDGGRGTKYSEGGKDGDNGGKGYVRIEWTGNL